MTKRTGLAMMLMWITMTAMAQGTMQQQVGGTDIKVEFFTPSIVRVTKHPVGHTTTDPRLVVTARPEAVKTTRHGNSLSSDVLTATIDTKTGAISFTTAKGKTLLREKNCGFEERREGNDAGAYRMTQTFTLDISALAPGAYFVRLTGERTVAIRKLIVK